MNRDAGKVYAVKKKCTRCGECCKTLVCDLGLVMLATRETPCPALEYYKRKYWCGLVTHPARYIFTGLGLSDAQYEGIESHTLRVNNFGEGCDLEMWRPIGELRALSRERAEEAVPPTDCSGRVYSISGGSGNSKRLINSPGKG